MSNLNATRSTVKSPTKTGSQPNILPSNARSETDPKKLNQDPSELLDSVGRISLENDETSYVEGTHWSAILDGVWHFFDPLLFMVTIFKGADKEADRLLN